MSQFNLINPGKKPLLEKWGSRVAPLEGISQWTTAAELAWLAEAVEGTNGGIVGEVGSYKGKSACAMALGNPKRIVCVDRFQDNTGPDFLRNTSRYINGPELTLLSVESAEGARICKKDGIQFDFFFVDGSHTREDVLRDISVWRDLVKPGGILAFHDCFPGEPDNGISQALDDVFPGYHLVADSIACVKI